MSNDDNQIRIRQLEELLEAKILQLNAVTQELDDLSFAISHDLKAPVRAIAGFAAILAEDEADRLSSEGKRVIGVIEKNSQKLSAMLSEIVSYSSISKKNVLLAEVDMNKLVNNIQATIMSTREQQLLEFSAVDLLPCKADENMMRLVWINLFNMALLYAEKNGFLQLTVTCEKQGEQIAYSLAVNNNVLQADDPHKLDELNNEILSRESLEGNGTGAAFIKRVIFKHKGHFWIQAIPGIECIFNISLPLK